MSSIIIAGDTSGTVTLQAPAVAGSNVISVPAATGTMVVTGQAASVSQTMLAANVAGNGPAFSAYPSGTQSVTSGVYTKVACNTEEFDTNANYDNATNYRFTPTVAGYYQVNGAVNPNGTSTGSCVAAIYKNGSAFKYGPYIQTTNANSSVSALVYLNGSTDYIEMYAYITAVVASLGNGASSTYFQASLVRAA